MISQRRLTDIRRELLKAQNELTQELKADKSRKRGDLNRKVHEIRQMLTPGYVYMSQAGQDAVVDRFFKQKTGGTFVDVGGYDGVTGSNTVFFEKWRGWTGALVEPVAANLVQAKALRSCPCLGYAVADQDGTAEFITVTEGFTQMSGLSQSYDETMLKRVRENPRHKETAIEVPTKPLTAILQEVGIEHPDFISLDIEGGELTALQSFPFKEHRVGMWSIENNTGSREIVALMKSHNYDLIDFCGPDELYVLRKT